MGEHPSARQAAKSKKNICVKRKRQKERERKGAREGGSHNRDRWEKESRNKEVGE